jgi:flagellar hook-associated protein 2
MAEITSNYDYSMIGSMGGEGAQSVNGDMINKIRAAEEESIIDPISEKIDNIALETEKIDEIKAKIADFQDIVSYFDLNNDENVFNQFLFDTTGDSAVFDATNMSTLEEGTTQVNVSQLAQKDVYQSNVVLEADLESNLNAGTFTIQIGSEDAIEFDTTGKTLSQIASEINGTEGIAASVEETGTGEYRLAIKSSDPGLDNALMIRGDASISLGYSEFDTDGVTEITNATNHTLSAQNLQANIDGIDYNVSSNSITTQGNLTITALKVDAPGEYSSVTVSKDSSAVTVAAEALATQYNELLSLVNEELYSPDSVIGDKDTLRTIVSDIKNMLFLSFGAKTPEFGDAVDEYGDTIYAHSNVTNNDKNIFSYGFELDKSGNLSIDTEIFNKAVDENFDDLKNVFTGVYENKGLGVQIKDYLDTLSGYDGLLTKYEESMGERQTELESEKEDEIERLDSKYGLMAQQFSEYSAIIAQLEASFGGLKMMIEQSTSGN